MNAARPDTNGAPADIAMPSTARALGMMVGGALGDALGGVIEFLSIEEIRARYGHHGIVELPGNLMEPALITDDTQMALFTLEGLIRGHRRHRTNPTATRPESPSALSDVVHAVHDAYQRWLHTQYAAPREATDDGVSDDGLAPGTPVTGWLITHPELHHRRAPGATCLSALQATRTPATGLPAAPLGSTTHRLNDSKGCGAVMRAAPVALWPGDRDTVFRLAVDTGALTHSHPSGYLAAGTLAVITRELLHDTSIPDAITTARTVLTSWPRHEEVLTALDTAVRLAQVNTRLSPEDIATHLGGGWVGEQALAIALYASLRADSFADGVRIAVNHSGDSDSTGAIAGNILGAHLGHSALPKNWPHCLELTDVISQITLDACMALYDAGPLSPQERTAILDEQYPLD